MSNVQMIRKELGLVSIPIERAVFCENCESVSNSAWSRCGSCGSDKLLELAPLLGGAVGTRTSASGLILHDAATSGLRPSHTSDRTS